MRVTVATLLCASLALASPHAEASRSHDAVAKRLRDRDEMRNLALYFGRGEHDIDEVPDGLTYPGEDEHDDSLFGEGPEDFADDHVYTYGNGTSDVVTERELEELVERSTKSKKQGLAWTAEVPAGLKALSGKGLFGLYTWTEWRPDEARKYGLKFFPMLKSDARKDKFKKAVNNKAYADGWILGPNEVNIRSESPMNPSHAAWLINTYMVPLKKKYGYKIVGPSFANGNTAFTWFAQFKKTQPAAYKALDAVALHYYGTTPEKVIAYLKQWHAEFPDKPIWITEIGCQSYVRSQPQCSQSQANNYMKKITQFVESTPWITSVFWYSTFVHSRVGVNKVNALFASANGALSAFGKAWLSV